MAIALFLLSFLLFPVTRFLGYHATYSAFGISKTEGRSILAISIGTSLLLPFLAMAIGTVLEIGLGALLELMDFELPIWSLVATGTLILSFTIFLIINNKKKKTMKGYFSELIVDSLSMACFAGMITLQSSMYPDFWRWN